jgi:pimeloyl-ACP methyl ester carboxylesterase
MKKLILLHGALGSKKQFYPLVELLSSHYKALTMDFTGHGEEPASEKEFSISQFSKDLVHFLEEHTIEKADIFGYSMGGSVALYTARLYPEKVNRIFTLATKFDWNPQSSIKEAAMLDAEKIKIKVPAFAQSLLQRHGAKWEKVLAFTADMMLEMGRNNPFTTREAAEIKNKVLMTVGDSDNMVSREETENIQKHIQDSAFKLMPSTPHPFEKVNQEMLAAEIKSFFN